jgi:hypothetical protein
MGHIHLTWVITNNLDLNGNKVDRSMSEHLKNSMEVKSSHIVPLLIGSPKNICNPQPNAFNVAKIAKQNIAKCSMIGTCLMMSNFTTFEANFFRCS